jgi:polysaccharide biosynthesis/export protein
MTVKKLTISVGLLAWMLAAAAWAQSQGANLNAADRGAGAPRGPAPEAASVPPQYRVGESDVLHINVWKEPEVTQTVTVRTDGNISLPLINEIKVSGMTPLEIQGAVTEKLKAFITNPQVTVTVTDIRSKRAFITGEIARPGGYPLNAETTVLQLIAQAGGFTTFAKRDNIVILRFAGGKQERLPFKYKAVVQGKNSSQNIALQPGDTVVVP